jgi:glycosyltransferase involved in cell wall biosynthesis
MCDSGGAENVEKTLVVACIPAFNEEGRIGGVVVQVRKYVDRVVVCDDGSVDLTGAIAEGLGAVVVRHERNRSYGVSLNLFAEVLRQEEVVGVTLDVDGQHDPADKGLTFCARGDGENIISRRGGWGNGYVCH